MVSYRLLIGIIASVSFSFFTVFFFTMEDIILQIQLFSASDPLKVVILMIGANFKFDLISYFIESPTFFDFFSPQLLASILIGFLSGTISKGLKRGLIASTIVIITDVLIWILLSVISGEDLMALFQGAQLSATIGGILTAILGAIVGGILGGLISGPYENSY
ncbi:MAG: hypothetical protein EU542_00350 [Promethearchaeota archaeon]|jgi:hypothetical protein|nr:MAG: hypothetical protein EU542_00350 [Candidatus Lokiarchaeota archaeon]